MEMAGVFSTLNFHGMHQTLVIKHRAVYDKQSAFTPFTIKKTFNLSNSGYPADVSMRNFNDH